MVSPQARREQVAFACEHGLSERRACGLLSMARSTLSYALRLPACEGRSRDRRHEDLVGPVPALRRST